MTLTPEQAKSLLDDLFALPDRLPKGKKEAKPKEKPAPAVRLATAPSPRAWKPVLALVEVVHQHCTTCGSEHQYLRNRRVRFEATTPGTLHAALEIPTLTPEHLNRHIDHAWEDTEICPMCLMLSTQVDDIISLTTGAIQLELFHG